MGARHSLIAAALAALAIVAVARPGADRGATHVVAIRAGGGDVPSNLLRIYVELSAAMEPGTAYEHIHLVDESGHVTRDAFLELREELWSSDHRRFTLLFDPGRIKRGIRSNLEMGAPLVAGRRYRLIVDSTWRDARNYPLGASYEQELRVAGFDSIRPNPTTWRVSSPRSNTNDTLHVDFGEPLDYALAMRLITVVDARGDRIDGHAALDNAARSWTFVPTGSWQRGARLVIDPALEDLAGNNLLRAFDADRAAGDRVSDAALTDTTPRIRVIVLRD